MTIPQTIDVSSLSAYQKVLSLWKNIGAVAFTLYVCLFIIFCVVLSLPVTQENTARYQALNTAFGISVTVPLAVGWFAGIRYWYLRGKYNLRVVRHFIDDNNWLTKSTSSIDKIPSILLGAGSYRTQYYPFSGDYKGRRFSSIVFEYEGEYARPHRFLSIHFALPKSYPMLVLDNRLNDKLRTLSNLPTRIPNGVRLRLEGDFDNYYTVTTTEGSEQHAMHVLSPDIMLVLRDNAMRKVDVEISGKNLFVMYEADFYTQDNVEALFTVADALLKELNALARSWMESSKGEERVIAKTARTARYKIIYRPDYVAAFSFLLGSIVFVGVMLSGILR